MKGCVHCTAMKDGHTWSRELFSDSALSALNISTTTSTVMATVDGCLSLKMAHISSVSQCLDFMSSDHFSRGPVCAHTATGLTQGQPSAMAGVQAYAGVWSACLQKTLSS